MQQLACLRCVRADAPAPSTQMRQCARDGAVPQLSQSLGLGLVALFIAWAGAVGAALAACRCGCAVCGCGLCCAGGAECRVGFATAFSWFFLATATVLWIVQFSLLGAAQRTCGACQIYGGDTGRVCGTYDCVKDCHAFYMPFGLGVAASVFAVATLLLQLLAVWQSQEAITERRQRTLQFNLGLGVPMQQVMHAGAQVVVAGTRAVQILAPAVINAGAHVARAGAHVYMQPVQPVYAYPQPQPFVTVQAYAPQVAPEFYVSQQQQAQPPPGGCR
jgi:hypothetical protein